MPLEQQAENIPCKSMQTSVATNLPSDCTAGAIACTTAAVLLPQDLTVCIFGTTVDHKYLWLCFALALWGLGQGAGPVVEALLADSTRTGQLPRPEAIHGCNCNQLSINHT